MRQTRIDVQLVDWGCSTEAAVGEPRCMGHQLAHRRRVHRSLDAAAVRKSSLVRVSVRLHDPQLAADVANKAAQVYQARSLRVQQEGVRGIRVFVEEQLARFRGQLDDSEQGLKKMQASVDKWIAKIDEIIGKKDAELMEV
mgnify:CR=1 FL=1